MIRLRPDRWAGTSSPELLVDRNVEGDPYVELSIELEKAELVGYRRETPELDDLLERMLEGDEKTPGHQLATEVRFLRKRLGEAEGRLSVDRSFSPDEARELAAVLVHYAGEIEAGR